MKIMTEEMQANLPSPGPSKFDQEQAAFDREWQALQTTWDDLHISESERPSHAPNRWGQSQSVYDSPYAAHYYTGPNELKIGNITGLGQELQKIIGASQLQGESLLQKIQEGGTGAFEDWREGFESDFAEADADRSAKLTEFGSLIDQLGGRLGDLESRNFHVGDIAGLEQQLADIVEQTGTGDQQLTDLINQFRDAGQKETDAIRQDLGRYLTTADYEESMGNRLGSLQDTMRDEFGRDIAALNIDQVRDDIRAQGGDLSALTRDFAGLTGEVAGIRGERGDELRALEDKLVSDYSDKLLSLESGFDTDLEGVRDVLGQDVARLTGQDEALSGRIEDVKGALGDYRTEAAGKFADVTQGYTEAVGDVRTDLTSAISGVSSDLSGQISQAKTEGAEAIQDVYASRADQLGRMQSDWGKNLQAQEDLLTGRIDRGEAALNERLTQLSSSMNYRLLGDSALGIKSRRSDAHRSGNVRRGTGQLSRGMRMNTLNIA